jgi:hypothetical protein
MALARVVEFEGVTQERIDELKGRIESEDGPPEGVPATEMFMLYDGGSGSAIAIILFDNEDDYQQGDATLSAMPSDDVPGSRTSVRKFDVAARATI